MSAQNAAIVGDDSKASVARLKALINQMHEKQNEINLLIKEFKDAFKQVAIAFARDTGRFLEASDTGNIDRAEELYGTVQNLVDCDLVQISDEVNDLGSRKERNHKVLEQIAEDSDRMCRDSVPICVMKKAIDKARAEAGTVETIRPVDTAEPVNTARQVNTVGPVTTAGAGTQVVFGPKRNLKRPGPKRNLWKRPKLGSP